MHPYVLQSTKLQDTEGAFWTRLPRPIWLSLCIRNRFWIVKTDVWIARSAALSREMESYKCRHPFFLPTKSPILTGFFSCSELVLIFLRLVALSAVWFYVLIQEEAA